MLAVSSSAMIDETLIIFLRAAVINYWHYFLDILGFNLAVLGRKFWRGWGGDSFRVATGSLRGNRCIS